MTAARYWRAVALQAFAGGDVELGAFHLLDKGGLRLDQLAEISCSVVPAVGAVANLSDSDLATVCRFSAKDVLSAGFALVWDFGAGQGDVYEGRLAAGASRDAMLSHYMLQRSNDGVVWVAEGTMGAYQWMGPNAWAKGSTSARMVWSTTAKSSRVNLDTSARVAFSTSGGYSSVISSSAVNAGKWYVEMTSSSGYGMPGIASEDHARESSYPGANGQSIGLYFSTVYISDGTTSIGPTSAGTVGLMIDLDARVLRYTDGATTSAAFAIPWAGPVFLATGNGSSGATFQTALNAGQDAFKYALPAGYTGGFGDLRIFDPLPVRTKSLPIQQFAKPQEMPVFTTGGLSLVNFNDVEFGGNGRVYGTVKRKGPPDVPLSRRVRLHRSRDGQLVREAWSDKAGYYEFAGIAEKYDYDVIAWDHELQLYSVIANNKRPEVA